MRVKPKPRVAEVRRIQGRFSDARFVEACPDQRRLYPSSPCATASCPWRVLKAEYLNCSFVVAATGGHSLQEIADFTGLSREGINKIVIRALGKIKLQLEENCDLQEPGLATGSSDLGSKDDGAGVKDPRDVLLLVGGGKLAGS